MQNFIEISLCYCYILRRRQVILELQDTISDFRYSSMELNRNIDEHNFASDTESESSSETTAGDEYLPQGQISGLQPYQFEPVIDIIRESSESDDEYSSEEEDESRLDNLDW
jgi:hypothetical protein